MTFVARPPGGGLADPVRHVRFTQQSGGIPRTGGRRRNHRGEEWDAVNAFPADDIWDASMRETSNSTAERREVHNVSVDERVARAQMCGQVHLPSGRTCILPFGHLGSCGFEDPDRAQRVAERELMKES